ncbi:MAG TPA: hypothetical protein ENK18_11605 [Deltaproteobacteria bacterium]|nr:hypothetical protein [Deltaproteobacteria bacterium]
MLPDTELLCDLNNGLTLCDANAWHYVFLAQSALVISLGLANAGLGLRHWLGRLDTPLWVARRFSLATLTAAIVPLSTGLWLREQVRRASFDCYLQHDATGCTHTLVERGHEMAGVLHWVGWTEVILVVTCLFGLAMLSGSPRGQR